MPPASPTTTSGWISATTFARLARVARRRVPELAQSAHVRTYRPPLKGSRVRYCEEDVRRLVERATSPPTEAYL
jgi:hypothetical protein